ncbi:hypothetical protein [Aeromonas salmonicida]|uniref:hypothetical protein n=1 Tax=Aeromonas salmonicida TaxID=645 RepID=UPI0039A5933D
MRRIVKKAECKELRDWKRLNISSPQNIHYDNLGREQRAPMLNALILEQGYLCAYTMKPIYPLNDSWQAHIEHIYPRSRHPARSVDWQNMLACVPASNAHCDFGAKLKDNYDPQTQPFLVPTTIGVSSQFKFRENGEVEGLTNAAKECVDEKVLNLNHPYLVNDRAGKIKGALNTKPSAAAARQRAIDLRKFKQDGTLEPYCEAIAQALETYATRLDNRAKRVRGASR